LSAGAEAPALGVLGLFVLTIAIGYEVVADLPGPPAVVRGCRNIRDSLEMMSGVAGARDEVSLVVRLQHMIIPRIRSYYVRVFSFE
jgi:hypothetical protein